LLLLQQLVVHKGYLLHRKEKGKSDGSHRALRSASGKQKKKQKAKEAEVVAQNQVVLFDNKNSLANFSA